MTKTPFMYRFAKIILGPIFKVYYKPTIIGKENIPTSGATLIVGTHTHLYDQCLTVLSTKRTIKYMAKKEYFDDKRVAWFFKASGCIPVDRSHKDDKATQAALKTLKNDDVIGLFPEGTRNSPKEERLLEIYNEYFKEEFTYEEFNKKIKKQNPKASRVNKLEELLKNKKITLKDYQKYIFNIDVAFNFLLKKRIITKKEYDASYLLPFKYGTVSMAAKTGAMIVPFAITGTFKFRSKDLTIRYGKPFKVGKMTYEEANIKLFNEVEKLIRISLKEDTK